MIRRRTKFALVAVVAGAMVAFPVALALAATDTDDHLPANKAFTDTSKATSFSGTVAGIPVTSNCTKSVVSGKTSATGTFALTLNKPSFTGCTDTLGGTDTVKTFGTWTAKYVDAANDEAAEKNPDATIITIPKAGATVTSTAAKGCVITVAPKAPQPIKASYNDSTGVATFSAAAIPASTSAACPGGVSTGTSHFSASYKASPILKDNS